MQKMFVRAFVLVTCLIMFSSAVMPVKAKAGLFDESWLDDWNIYNNEETFGNIDAEYNDPISGASVIGDEINAHMAYHYILKGFAINHTDELEKIEKYYGYDYIYEIAKNYWSLAEAAEDIQVAVKKLNAASESSKALYVKTIYEITKNVDVDVFEKYKEDGRTNAESITDYFEWLGSFISDERDTSGMTENEESEYRVLRFIIKTLFTPYYDNIITDIKDMFVWDGKTHSVLESAKASAGQWMRILFERSYHQRNVDAFKDIYVKVADYILKVKSAAEQLYSMVDPEYFDNIALEEKPGLVEEHLAKMLRGIGSSLQNILDRNTLRFENIVYGRVRTRTGNVGLVVNNFSFELANKNVYGVTGATIYVILRGLLFLGILLYLMYYLAKDAMLTSSRVRSKLKENVGYVILAICLLYAMPNLLDLALHLRDSLLYTLADRIQDSTFAKLSGLAKNFREAAESAGTFVSACEYLGIVVITAYLAFLYIGMACSMTIMFAFFPVFIIFSFRDRKVMSEWVNFTLGIITTPLIDAVLFLLPLVATHISNVPDVVQLLLCMSIIPARGAIRKLLGFSSSMGAELVGLGAIMAAGRAVGAVTRTVRNTAHTVAGGVSSTMSDRANADFYDDLAKKDSEDGSGKLSGVAASAAGERASAFGDDVAKSPIGETAGKVAESGGASGGGTAATSSRAGMGIGHQSSKEEQEFLKSRANVNNFENGEFSRLDPATKAKLYRERAKKTAAQTVLKTAGGVAGGVAGGSAGLGASTFLGSNAAMIMASSGMEAGSSVGSAAGNTAGTAVAYAARESGALGSSLYSRIHNSSDPSTINAAMSVDSGIGREDFDTDDIRAGIIGDSAEGTMSNILENDSEFANIIRSDFDSIINNPDLDLDDKQAALITSYARYADIGAAMQNDDRIQAYDTAYIPTNSKLQSMNAMHDCLRVGAEARIDENGSIYFSKPAGMSDSDYKSLEYAFPKINYGYNRTSYYDEKKRTSYSPSDGYIGSGMIENMKRGGGTWDIPILDSTNIDNVTDASYFSPSDSTHSTTSSADFAGGAVKGGPQYNPRQNDEDGGEDPMEKFYREHPMEKFYRDHPEMRPNAFS